MININDSIFSFVYDLNRGPETIFDLFKVYIFVTYFKFVFDLNRGLEASLGLKGAKGTFFFVILAG